MLASVIRTVTPLIIGVIVGQAARVGLDLDPGAVTAIVTVLAGWAHYQVSRYIEQTYPAAGRWLLGAGLTGKTPVYPDR